MVLAGKMRSVLSNKEKGKLTEPTHIHMAHLHSLLIEKVCGLILIQIVQVTKIRI